MGSGGNQGVRPWAIVLFVLFAQAAIASTPPAEKPPVPLYTPGLLAPLETGGTGLAPEVSVHVTVDAQGRVTAVDIEAIRPSSEYDEAFKKAVRETLERWRYAPATRDGEPVPTTLSWRIQFPATEAQTDSSTPLAWRSTSSEGSMSDLRQRILSMPLEQRTKLLQENAGIAKGFLDAQAVQKFNSPRFMVFTDAPTPDLARVLATNLEATFDTLSGILGKGVEPQPEPYRIVVFMYKSEAQFDELKRSVSVAEWSAGFYNPVGMLAFHMEMISSEALLGVMLHEATHAYIDRYVARPGTTFPRWLDEGFSEYVGNSKITKGQLVPGKTRRTEFYRTPWVQIRATSRARDSVYEVRDAMKAGRALSVDELVGASLDEFYGEKRDLYYPMSWLLVHFLRHGERGWAENAFPQLMLYVAEGYPPREAFRATYGDPAKIEASFQDYVMRF
jgi:TonB family protein